MFWFKINAYEVEWSLFDLSNAWWYHDMEMLFALLAFYRGIHDYQKKLHCDWWSPLLRATNSVLVFTLLLGWISHWTNNRFASDSDAMIVPSRCDHP